MEKEPRIITNELLFILYFWRLVILKPITTTYVKYGMTVLLVYSALIVAIFFAINTKGWRFVVEPIYKMFAMFYALFVIDYFVRPNSNVTTYMYEFVLYGIIPVILLLKVSDLKKLIKLFCITSCILLVVYCTDPLNNFRYFDNYMTFGFQLAFPTFLGIDIGRTYYRKKILLILELVAIAELLVFANRGCILSVVVYFILKDIYLTRKKNTRVRFAVKALIFIAILVIAFNIESIVYSIYDALSESGYSSYSFNQYIYYLKNGTFMTGSTTGGRIGIWKQAMEMFLAKPFLGNGTGSFIEEYGYYTHNIIYDMLVQYGILVSAVVFLTIARAIYRMICVVDYDYRVILLMFLCMWFPKLFLSSHLFQEIGIWCFLAIALSRRFRRIHDVEKLYDA